MWVVEVRAGWTYAVVLFIPIHNIKVFLSITIHVTSIFISIPIFTLLVIPISRNIQLCSPSDAFLPFPQLPLLTCVVAWPTKRGLDREAVTNSQILPNHAPRSPVLRSRNFEATVTKANVFIFIIAVSNLWHDIWKESTLVKVVDWNGLEWRRAAINENIFLPAVTVQIAVQDYLSFLRNIRNQRFDMKNCGVKRLSGRAPTPIQVHPAKGASLRICMWGGE